MYICVGHILLVCLFECLLRTESQKLIRHDQQLPLPRLGTCSRSANKSSSLQPHASRAQHADLVQTLGPPPKVAQLGGAQDRGKRSQGHVTTATSLMAFAPFNCGTFLETCNAVMQRLLVWFHIFFDSICNMVMPECRHHRNAVASGVYIQENDVCDAKMPQPNASYF